MLKVHFVLLFIFLLANTGAKPSFRKISNGKNGCSDDQNPTTVAANNATGGDYIRIEQDKSMQFGQQLAQEAMKAAADAKAQQGPMSKKASQQAMQMLADKAEAYAKQADAVLAGKVAVVEEIVQEIAEAGDVITEETGSLSRLKEVLKESKRVSWTSKHEISILHQSLTYTRNILKSLLDTQQMLTDHIEKTREVIKAAQKKETGLRKVLNKAKMDLEEAKATAKKYNDLAEETQNEAQYPDNVEVAAGHTATTTPPIFHGKSNKHTKAQRKNIRGGINSKCALKSESKTLPGAGNTETSAAKFENDTNVPETENAKSNTLKFENKTNIPEAAESSATESESGQPNPPMGGEGTLNKTEGCKTCPPGSVNLNNAPEPTSERDVMPPDAYDNNYL